MKRVERITTEVEQMQAQLQERRWNNISSINRTFLQITKMLNARKQQLLDGIEKTTADRMRALNEQHQDLLNLYAQMNSYLELVEIS